MMALHGLLRRQEGGSGELFNTIGQKATSRLRPFLKQKKPPIEDTSDVVQSNLNSAQLSSK